ncbi:MAG: hypothetical protein QXU45_04965 [Candidatus Bathyarchaeia archaeon]
MAVFLLDMWTVAKGKEAENEDVVKQILQYGGKHHETLQLVKSLRCFRQSIGGKPPGKFVLVTEFASLHEMEESFKKIREDSEWRKIERKWREVMDHTSSESLLWSDVFRELWKEK